MNDDLPEERLVEIEEELEGVRDSLERIAEADVPFSDRAQAALDWLDDRKTDTGSAEAIADA